MKKKLIIIIISLVIMISFSVWYVIRVSHERERERELLEKAAYASIMHFTFSDCWRGSFYSIVSVIQINRRNSDEVQYTEIVLVHSVEEAARFGEYVLVVWPQENYQVSEGMGRMRGTQHMVDAVNEGINRVYPHVDFRDYGLQKNEITMIDAVENWDIVNKLIRLYAGP
jgi:hypothetical protein